jgi:hypothetical protein
LTNSDEPEVTEAAEAADTVLRELHAYELEVQADDDQMGPPPIGRGGRTRWALSVIAVLAGAAALLVAGTVGMRMMRGAAGGTVAQPTKTLIQPETTSAEKATTAPPKTHEPPTSTPSPTVTTTEQPAFTRPDRDSQFLADWHARGHKTMAGDDAEVVGAQHVCSEIQNGRGVPMQWVKDQFSLGEAGALAFVGTATRHYCPEWMLGD